VLEVHNNYLNLSKLQEVHTSMPGVLAIMSKNVLFSMLIKWDDIQIFKHHFSILSVFIANIFRVLDSPLIEKQQNACFPSR
jgi:hypothetical protein